MKFLQAHLCIDPALPPTFPVSTVAPWQLLALAPAEHWGKCSFLPLPHLHGIPCSFRAPKLPPAPLLRAMSCALFPAPTGCHLHSEHQRYQECYCCLPCSEVIFLNLFWLFTSHVLTSFACNGLFLLLNGSWCFTWRRAPFCVCVCESCRVFKTQFACEKSWS